MVLVNKHVFMQLPCPCIITGFQNAATVVLNVLAARAGLLSMNPWRLSEIRQYLVQGALFAATLGLSNFGLPRVATATLIIPKSLTTVFCMVAESAMGMAGFSAVSRIALLVSFGGSVLYGMADTHYEFSGYLAFLLVSVLNCLVSVYERKINLSVEQTPTGCSCYKNMVSVPFFVAFAWMTREDQKFATAQLDSFLLLLILVSTVLGFLLSLCYATLYKLTSATTVLAAANVNKLATSVVGGRVFSEQTTLSAGFGLFLSLGGVVVYGLDKANVELTDPRTLGGLVASLTLGIALLTAYDGDDNTI